MTFVEARLWLDDIDAERDDRIGEHECFITLFDQANNRYLGNSLTWLDALEPLVRAGDMGDVIDSRFRVVPRCHCDQVWCKGEEWAGPRLSILRDSLGVLDFDGTQDAAIQEWHQHVEELLAARDARHAAAAKRRGGYLVALDEIGKLDGMERFGAIRAARAALDAAEVDAVVAERRAGRSWTEIGVQMGISKQAARERFVRHDPQGEAA